MKILWLLLCIFFSFQCAAEKAHSRIELDDGSILYGQVKTQDHGHETYTIELLSGPTLELDKAKIKSIKKIKAKTHKPYKINIAKSVRTFFQRPFFSSKERAHTVFINHFSQTFERDYDADKTYSEEYLFEGIGIGWRRYLNGSIATQLSINHGSLNKVKINSYDSTVSIERDNALLKNKTLTNIELSGLIGLGFFRPFQVFTGIGIAHDRFDSNNRINSRTTLKYTFGFGATWHNMQLSVRSTGLFPFLSDYDYLMVGDTLNIDLGWHF